jgi:prepilin-type N-terminal cleavage/methylation domain-containing protein
MKMKSMLRNKRGFTIVELLVVVAVIVVLSTLFINTATLNIRKSRDARRKTDLENIRSGIETYRSDCDAYPASISFGGSLRGSGSNANCAAGNTYINAIPQDPQNNLGKVYYYTSNGTTYTVCASLEAAASGAPVPSGCGSCGSSACNYSATNP